MQPPTDASGKPLTKNQHLLQWVDEMARLTKPERIVWCDGSEEEKHRLTEESVAKIKHGTPVPVALCWSVCGRHWLVSAFLRRSMIDATAGR